MAAKRKKSSKKKNKTVKSNAVKKEELELKEDTLEKKDKTKNNLNSKDKEDVNLKDSDKKNENEKIEKEDSNKIIENAEKRKESKIENIEKERSFEEKKQNEVIEQKRKELQKIEDTKNDNKKNKTKNSGFLVFVLILLIVILSTLFALLNMNSSNIAKGTKIKNIEVSNLTREEAKKKIEKALNIELMQDINIKYEDKYETNLSSSQIEFSYKIKDAVDEALKIGRSGNIIKDNYTLLYTMFFGTNIEVDCTYNEEFLNVFIENTETSLPGVVTQPSYYIENEELIVNKGIDGIGIDKDVFKTNILENIKNRNVEKIINNSEKSELSIPIIEKKADSINMDTIYKEIYTEPKDAYYELEPFNIYPEINGVDLEITLEEAKNQIETQTKEEYIFRLKITPPEVTVKSFGFEAFPNLVSSFSTKYVASNINRSKNLEIAAGKINGFVLMPNEVFSFNKVVGKRTVEEGYRDAAIYQDGAVVDGLAGGICQISSTLYNAVLLANLEIVERSNHSFTTSYAPAGRDATVVYGVKDFQFKNTRSYPIKIEATVSKGIATFKIHSVGLEETEYEVKIKPVITASIPYTTEQTQDLTLLPGQQIVKQTGQPGYRVTTYKELLKDGVSISNDVISNDVYKPMRRIVIVGP